MVMNINFGQENKSSELDWIFTQMSPAHVLESDIALSTLMSLCGVELKNTSKEDIARYRAIFSGFIASGSKDSFLLFAAANKQVEDTKPKYSDREKINISVSGMCGVGKTTLLVAIRRLLEDNKIGHSFTYIGHQSEPHALYSVNDQYPDNETLMLELRRLFQRSQIILREIPVELGDNA